jgi:hypothetical protein
MKSRYDCSSKATIWTIDDCVNILHRFLQVASYVRSVVVSIIYYNNS